MLTLTTWAELAHLAPDDFEHEVSLLPWKEQVDELKWFIERGASTLDCSPNADLAEDMLLDLICEHSLCHTHEQALDWCTWAEAYIANQIEDAAHDRLVATRRNARPCRLQRL